MYYSSCCSPQEVEHAVAARYDSLELVVKAGTCTNKDCIHHASIRVAILSRACRICPECTHMSNALHDAWCRWCSVRAMADECDCVDVGQ